MERSSLIPPPLDDDDEDVHWALSTATALWGRGERVEALRWLRRAAERASDCDADARSNRTIEGCRPGGGEEQHHSSLAELTPAGGIDARVESRRSAERPPRSVDAAVRTAPS